MIWTKFSVYDFEQYYKFNENWYWIDFISKDQPILYDYYNIILKNSPYENYKLNYCSKLIYIQQTNKLIRYLKKY